MTVWCLFFGHGPIISRLEEIDGRLRHTHDFCERCGKRFAPYFGANEGDI